MSKLDGTANSSQYRIKGDLELGNGHSVESATASGGDDLEEFAKTHGLIYVIQSDHGFTRVRAGKGFFYKDIKSGERLTEEKHLERIRSLVLPPAWQEVWICSTPRGHIQATGFDKKGRKQYRYHDKWNEVRNLSKFQNLTDFGDVLPQIRKQIERDLSTRGLKKEKVLAAIVDIMLKTQIRIGNDVYAQQNGSYGLTTILNKHVEIKGKKIRFKFKGKSGIFHDVELSDSKLAKIVALCKAEPQAELFCYRDSDNRLRDVTSQDVNEYIKKVTGASITAKTIRTWSGTTRALSMVVRKVVTQSEKSLSKKFILDCVKAVSEALRNTKAVCRKYYIHPLVFEPKVIGTIKKVFGKKKQNAEVTDTQIEECLKAIIKEHS